MLAIRKPDQNGLNELQWFPSEQRHPCQKGKEMDASSANDQHIPQYGLQMNEISPFLICCGQAAIS